LALAHFKLNSLAVIQSGITAAHLDFRMVNKQVFAAVFRRNETKTFVCIEPLNCTFTHITLSKIMVNHYYISTFEFTLSKQTVKALLPQKSVAGEQVYVTHSLTSLMRELALHSIPQRAFGVYQMGEV